MVEMDPVGHPPKSPPPATLDLDDNVHLMNGSALASHAAPHGGSKTTSRIYDIYMIVLIVGLLVAGIVTILVANNWRANDPYEIAKIYHEKHPFIDGKNQLAYAIKYVIALCMHNSRRIGACLTLEPSIPNCFCSARTSGTHHSPGVPVRPRGLCSAPIPTYLTLQA